MSDLTVRAPEKQYTFSEMLEMSFAAAMLVIVVLADRPGRDPRETLDEIKNVLLKKLGPLSTIIEELSPKVGE